MDKNNAQKESDMETPEITSVPETPADDEHTQDFRLIYDFLRCKGGLSLPTYDVILVFGTYSELPARKAAELYKAGKAPRMLLTGKGPQVSGPHPYLPTHYATEADYAYNIVHSLGIPKEAVLMESISTNTLQNVLEALRILQKQGISPSSILFCAPQPLNRRALATLSKHCPGAWTIAAQFEDESWMQDQAKRLRMLDEFPRLIAYALKGDIAPTPVPDDVQAAVDRLRTAFPSATP
jgi:uncharacterized SAM-binding protein YcdF (DUF218 family)